ncbi:hypothetical protein [Larkinella rosea]|uniref:Uncharacterized protein n=1 Tax=Larkinella rosea TaxID=2025312 RepID=A0A3P1BC60_9BACT|nr:hypothetical protein [Larkinella rosea]RRA98609.1 hypothetical protein EHT25_26755 [Larkinella rosea]
MDQNERELHAQQHKERVDITVQHAKAWDKFQKRRGEYSQKYGATYADILLQQEKEALEAQFNQELIELSQGHNQQWEVYHEAPSSMEKPIQLPFYLRETEPILSQNEKETKENDTPTVQSSRTVFSNPFKQTDHGQKQIPDNNTKDMNQSQDYMKAMLSAQKANLIQEKAGEPDKKPVSMSTRFSQGLSYTQAAEQSGRSPERHKDLERD